MADRTSSYEARVEGLWNTTHTLTRDGERVGVLRMNRNAKGLISEGVYTPEKGEVLTIRRDPGLLRSQFSLWTDGPEWLGSSLRWNVVQREVVLHTGSRPLRLLPSQGFGCGWNLVAPKTGLMASVRGGFLSRKRSLAVYRRLDFELLVFAYFLGSMIFRESLLPGPSTEPIGGYAPDSKTAV